MEHLFTATVGVPLRSYVLRAKLQRAMQVMTTGAPLAKVAVEAGFADQAHLWRTFRRMLGFIGP